MLSDANDYMCKKKAKLKELKKSYQALQDSFEELKISHGNLNGNHEMLKEAHISSLTHENKSKVSIRSKKGSSSVQRYYINEITLKT